MKAGLDEGDPCGWTFKVKNLRAPLELKWYASHNIKFHLWWYLKRTSLYVCAQRGTPMLSSFKLYHIEGVPLQIFQLPSTL